MTSPSHARKEKDANNPPGFASFVSENLAASSYSPTYGMSAMNLARFTASLEARWNAAQLPDRLRENILL
jgi:hypothetical protein